MTQENSSLKEQKVAVADLKLGMYVSRLDKDWTQSSFLFQGFLIEEDAQIQQLIQECQHVFIDLAKEELPKTESSNVKIAQVTPTKKATFGFDKFLRKEDEPPPPPVKKREQTNQLSDIVGQKIAVAQIKPPEKAVSFSSEMGTAHLTHKKNTETVKHFISDVQQGGTVDTLVAEQAVNACMGSMLRSPDAMMLTVNLKGKHLNTWQHSMNVSVLAISLGRYLNLSDEELITLGLCGMFHDIGMMLISKEVLAKAADKRELIHSHTRLGYDMLSKCDGQLNSKVAEVAFAHHENLDGSGFPRGLEGEQISPYARIVSIVDLYDTLTCDKPNKAGLSHYEAMQQIFKRVEANHFDKTLVNSFSQCIGTFPVGSLVEMNSGELAIVVEENINQRLKPIVMLVTTPDKKERAKALVNLAKEYFEGQKNTYTIKRLVNPHEYNLL